MSIQRFDTEFACQINEDIEIFYTNLEMSCMPENWSFNISNDLEVSYIISFSLLRLSPLLKQSTGHLLILC